MQETDALSNSSDEALVIQVQQGDSEKFGVIIERYERKLLRYGRKFLSDGDNIEDLVQDVFLSAYRNIQSFNPTLRFSPWIYRIAHNTFVNALRSKGRAPVFSLDLDTFVATPLVPTAEEKSEQEAIKEAVEKGLQKLEAKYREVLILYYLEDMQYKDIADVLHVPVGTVGIRLLRAKKELRKHLDPHLLA